MVLASSDNKSRFAIGTTAMIHISRNISFASCVDDEGGIESKKISGLQALGSVPHLPQVADARPQQLARIPDKDVFVNVSMTRHETANGDALFLVRCETGSSVRLCQGSSEQGALCYPLARRDKIVGEKPPTVQLRAPLAPASAESGWVLE